MHGLQGYVCGTEILRGRFRLGSEQARSVLCRAGWPATNRAKVKGAYRNLSVLGTNLLIRASRRVGLVLMPNTQNKTNFPLSLPSFSEPRVN